MGFINFRMTTWLMYYALQFEVRSGDFGVTEVYGPEIDGFMSVESNDQV